MTRTSLQPLLLIAVSCCVLGRAQDSVKQKIPPVVPIQTFDPAHHESASYADEAIQAALVARQGGNSVKITELSTKEERFVQLPEEMAQVDDIHKGVGNRLVVRGMVNGSGSEIVVIDRDSAKVIDKFVCYLPSISRDGRYIAFVKFYPSHFAEGTDDHYMLYDVAKEPVENRPPEIASNDWKTVGKCIYPIGVGNKDNDNVGYSRGSEHSSRSEFFWNPDQEQVFFADQLATAPQITLVLVDVAGNGGIFVKTITQNAEQLCPVNTAGAAACPILVRRVEFRSGAEATIAVTFEIVSTRQRRTVEYKSLQFQ